MAVTMTQVAREAGVSVSTVSHVINGTRPVAQRTRAAVQQAMDHLGFTHVPVARALAGGATTTVGVTVPLTSNPFYQELLGGIEGESRRRGLTMVVADTTEDPEREREVVANLLAHHVRGLLVSPSPLWAELGGRIVREHQVPCVLMDRVAHAGADQVGVENERGSMRLVEHLVELGHRRIACISGLAGLATTDERVAGYRAALLKGGITVDEALIVSGDSTERGGRRALRDLMAMPSRLRPTAVFIGNDAMTTGALRGMRELGLRLPQDLAFVCFDDPPWGDLVDPPLTALGQPSFAMGARAVQMLAARIAEPEAPVTTLRLAGEIAHRGSCGCGHA